MNNNKFLKIFCLLGFVAFAAVSCWATAESLHLLLPSWPLIMCWIIVAGFFFIASWGTKMIADSLNQKIYLEKRGLRLIGGILILIVFWLICSMPTNTHTFFYRSVINDKITDDISMTEGYLAQIKDNIVIETQIQEKCTELRNTVEIKLKDLEWEIKHDTNPGFGKKSKEILREFADLLGVAKIEPLTYRDKSIQGLQRLADQYREKIYSIMENRKTNIRREMTPSNNNYQVQAENDYKNLELVKQYIEAETLDVNDANDIKIICDKLNAGYATIRNYEQFVNFKNENDKIAYTSSNSVTKVKRMVSVKEVWADFLKGEYAGHGFIFWVIISILVDIAAFIFFDIAFIKRDE